MCIVYMSSDMLRRSVRLSGLGARVWAMGRMPRVPVLRVGGTRAMIRDSAIKPLIRAGGVDMDMVMDGAMDDMWPTLEGGRHAGSLALGTAVSAHGVHFSARRTSLQRASLFYLVARWTALAATATTATVAPILASRVAPNFVQSVTSPTT